MSFSSSKLPLVYNSNLVRFSKEQSNFIISSNLECNIVSLPVRHIDISK